MSGLLAIEGVKNPTASCGASSKEKTLMGVATPIPRLPLIPAASNRVFWLFPIMRSAMTGRLDMHDDIADGKF